METSEICKKFEINLDAFHDGELSAAEESEIEIHLTSCPSCVDRLAQIDRVVHSLKTMPNLSVPSALSERLDAIAAKRSNTMPFKKKVWVPLAAAAAVALIMVGAKTGIPGLTPTGAPTIANKTPAPPVTPTATNAPGITTKQEPVARTPEQPSQQAVVAAQSQTLSTPTTSEQQQSLASKLSTPDNPKRFEKTTTHEPTTMIAVKQESARSIEEDDSTIATVPNGASFNDAVGFSTDEDGLYDIKM